jgi:hypothetical protein
MQQDPARDQPVGGARIPTYLTLLAAESHRSTDEPQRITRIGELSRQSMP